MSDCPGFVDPQLNTLLDPLSPFESAEARHAELERTQALRNEHSEARALPIDGELYVLQQSADHETLDNEHIERLAIELMKSSRMSTHQLITAAAHDRETFIREHLSLAKQIVKINRE